VKDHQPHIAGADDEHPITPPSLLPQPGADPSVRHPADSDEHDSKPPAVQDHPPRVIYFQRAVLEKQGGKGYPHQRRNRDGRDNAVKLVDAGWHAGYAVQTGKSEHDYEG